LLDFKELLRTHFRVEVLAEDLRQRLEANPVFSLKQAFALCDAGSKGEITVQDIRFLIESRGTRVSDHEVQSLMDKFDKGSRRGTILQSEFIQEMVPKSPLPQRF